ncbi:MAG: hypothetical protein OWU33_08210 [Firmicutes bacterium]|nr:hypothetical protein [Bacillota bacterium]
MPRRWPTTFALFWGTVGLATLLGLVVWLMPPIVPAPNTVSASPLPPAPHHLAKPSQTSPPPGSRALSSANAFAAIDYQPFLSSLQSEAKSLGLTLVLPRSSYAGTSLEENYISGQVLTLVFNNMLVMESKTPLISYYRPLSTAAASLSSGATATWEWIPGEGGPPYRLNFLLDGTYVEMRLFSPPLIDTLSTAVRIANQFQPLGANGGAANG